LNFADFMDRLYIARGSNAHQPSALLYFRATL
jgi:hypothetical protein